jgi:ribokinase
MSSSNELVNREFDDEPSAEHGVAIVGSCNVDLFYYVDKFPKTGETIFAKLYEEHFGGKGANQALQVAKLSVNPEKVLFVGCVGSDKNGNSILNNFKNHGIHDPKSTIAVIDGVPSGLASITVDKEGHNQILLVSGTNFKVAPEHVDKAIEEIKKCRVLVCQNEIPLETSYHALKVGKENGLTTIYNPAPYVDFTSGQYSDILKYVDIFTPNEHEAASLVGVDHISTKQEIEEAAKKIHEQGAKIVIITLGSNGVAVYHQVEGKYTLEHVEGEKVQNVVDTTGAGDSFVGGLAYFLSCELELIDAIKLSNVVASISVQSEGTHRSYPERKDMMK